MSNWKVPDHKKAQEPTMQKEAEAQLERMQRLLVRYGFKLDVAGYGTTTFVPTGPVYWGKKEIRRIDLGFFPRNVYVGIAAKGALYSMIRPFEGFYQLLDMIKTAPLEAEQLPVMEYKGNGVYAPKEPEKPKEKLVHRDANGRLLNLPDFTKGKLKDY